MMFLNFFLAWARTTWARWRGYEILATGEEMQKRLDICRYCPHNVCLTCDACGCPLQSKVMLNTEQCPLKKWNRVWQKRVTIE
jgi:hypothetical protein